ncbi:RHS repeat-associated core domain-containing protein [Zemynaea arenosa]|nr:PAAR-like domain-containing protein [Massilia arenosa]
MANETVTKSSRFYCVSLTPDICKTPIGASTPPIPYNIIGEFVDTLQASPNVKSRSEPVYLHGKSYISTVKGDMPGKAGGVKSGTVGDRAESKAGSSTLRANLASTFQTARQVWMNAKNTLGVAYERSAQAARERLKPYAQKYKDEISDSVHQFGRDAGDTGDKIVKVSGAVAVVSAVTLQPEGVAAAAVGAEVGSGVAVVGAATDAGASVLDAGADWVLTGKDPDWGNTLFAAGSQMVASLLYKKVGALARFLRSEAKAVKPGKLQTRPEKPTHASSKPASGPQGSKDGRDGGKTKGSRKGKGDKPADCCPKNTAPGGRSVKSRKPVHLGTGEEILYQTDFELDGRVPIVWTRCYRSGSECEDWGLLGARWSTEFTASLSMCDDGIVYHDHTGRAVRLPFLLPGEQHNSRLEGFTLARQSDHQFVLRWLDDSTDVFKRFPVRGWLPHGYNGVNAMLPAESLVEVERFCLARRQDRDGRGYSIERFPDAKPDEPLIKVVTDEERIVVGVRSHKKNEVCIGRIEEIRGDGTHVCRAAYEYAAEVDGPDGSEDGHPVRFNLVKHTNQAGSAREYEYRHHLLTRYSDYLGFGRHIEWRSLATLVAAWDGRTVADPQQSPYMIDVTNSYQARAVATHCDDGTDAVRIDYLDAETTRLNDANGVTLEFNFDDNWMCTGVSRIGADGSHQSLGRRHWSAEGWLLSEINPVGATTRYEYDTSGNVTCVIDALGNRQHFEYSSQQQPARFQNMSGGVTTFAFDDAGYLTNLTDALGHTTTYRYNGRHDLIELVDAKGGVKKFDHDRMGRMTCATDCSGYSTYYSYDIDGHLIAIRNALGDQLSFKYDRLGNVTQLRYPDGANEQFVRDAMGRLIQHVDPLGYKTTYRYNGRGVLVERVDALGHAVAYEYDSALNLVAVVNPREERYCYFYNQEGRLATEVGFDGKTTTYAYDAAGNVVRTSCAGVERQFVYDRLGQLCATIDDDGTVRYTYTADGLIASATNSSVALGFEYNSVGNLIEERFTYQFAALLPNLKPILSDPAFSLRHTYDELGFRTQTSLPTGQSIDVLTYGSGHWHAVHWCGAPVVNVERDVLHRERLRHVGEVDGPVQIRSTYDGRSRLATTTTAIAGVSRSQRCYVYDERGFLTESKAQQGDERLHVVRYSVDPLGQLIAKQGRAGREDFAYDATGNLTSGAARYEFDRLREFAQGGVAFSHDYDKRGNLQRKSRKQLAGDKEEVHLRFNAADELIRVLDNNEVATDYVYDAFSRRVAKLSEKGATLFVWDGDNLLQEKSADKLTTFIYEPDSFIPLGCVVERNDAVENGTPAAQTLAFICDQVATPVEAVSNDGATLEMRDLTTWGGAPGQESNWSHLRFPGQQADEESGLHYNRFRYYDPVSGRYISQDPLRLAVGINLYRYVENPTAAVDPLGLYVTWHCGSQRWMDTNTGRFVRRPKNPAKMVATDGSMNFTDVSQWAQQWGLVNTWTHDAIKFPAGGFSYLLRSGKYSYSIHGHGWNPNAPLGSNAASGPTASIQRWDSKAGNRAEVALNYLTTCSWGRFKGNENAAHLPLKNSPY